MGTSCPAPGSATEQSTCHRKCGSAPGGRASAGFDLPARALGVRSRTAGSGGPRGRRKWAQWATGCRAGLPGELVPPNTAPAGASWSPRLPGGLGGAPFRATARDCSPRPAGGLQCPHRQEGEPIPEGRRGSFLTAETQAADTHDTQKGEVCPWDPVTPSEAGPTVGAPTRGRESGDTGPVAPGAFPRTLLRAGRPGTTAQRTPVPGRPGPCRHHGPGSTRGTCAASPQPWDEASSLRGEPARLPSRASGEGPSVWRLRQRRPGDRGTVPPPLRTGRPFGRECHPGGCLALRPGHRWGCRAGRSPPLICASAARPDRTRHQGTGLHMGPGRAGGAPRPLLRAADLAKVTGEWERPGPGPLQPLPRGADPR